MPNWSFPEMSVTGTRSNINSFMSRFLEEEKAPDGIHFFPKSFLTDSRKNTYAFVEAAFYGASEEEERTVTFSIQFAWSAEHCLLSNRFEDDKRTIKLPRACKVDQVDVVIVELFADNSQRETITCDRNGVVQTTKESIQPFCCPACDNVSYYMPGDEYFICPICGKAIPVNDIETEIAQREKQQKAIEENGWKLLEPTPLFYYRQIDDMSGEPVFQMIKIVSCPDGFRIAYQTIPFYAYDDAFNLKNDPKYANLPEAERDVTIARDLFSQNQIHLTFLPVYEEYEDVRDAIFGLMETKPEEYFVVISAYEFESRHDYPQPAFGHSNQMMGPFPSRDLAVLFCESDGDHFRKFLNDGQDVDTEVPGTDYLPDGFRWEDRRDEGLEYDFAIQFWEGDDSCFVSKYTIMKRS